ncbi:ROK family protein [Euzebya sp.]|uniref:ROK family protein n=1 Tax=Euzebya sp. TaxID=1971409 RepID=UPI0035171C14
MIVGLDVGGTSIEAVAVNQPGAPAVATWTGPTPRDGAEDLRAALRSAVRAVTPDGAADLRAVGVAIPGVVDPSAGTVSHAVNLGLDGTATPLAHMLEADLGVPVALDNDARAAALAALSLLRLRRPDIADVALVNIGTGLSVGLVIDGLPHRGPLGHAGEIGHVPLPGSEVPCACGLSGCLEARIAGPALARRWPAGDGRPAHALFAAAAAGDATAAALAEDVAEDVARLVHLVVNLTGIGDVVLGGGVAQAHGGLLDGVRRHLAVAAERSPLAADAIHPDRVVVAPADAALGAHGAAALAAIAAGTHQTSATHVDTDVPSPAAPPAQAGVLDRGETR